MYSKSIVDREWSWTNCKHTQLTRIESLELFTFIFITFECPNPANYNLTTISINYLVDKIPTHISLIFIYLYLNLNYNQQCLWIAHDKCLFFSQILPIWHDSENESCWLEVQPSLFVFLSEFDFHVSFVMVQSLSRSRCWLLLLFFVRLSMCWCVKIYFRSLLGDLRSIFGRWRPEIHLNHYYAIEFLLPVLANGKPYQKRYSSSVRPQEGQNRLE